MVLVEILAATLAHTLIGSLWYAPFAFGRTWQRIVYPSKRDEKRMRDGRLRAMISGVFAAILLSIAISILSRVLTISTIEQAIGLSFVLSGALVATVIQRVSYAQDDHRLILIDGGFLLVAVTAMTLVVLML